MFDGRGGRKHLRIELREIEIGTVLGFQSIRDTAQQTSSRVLVIRIDSLKISEWRIQLIGPDARVAERDDGDARIHPAPSSMFGQGRLREVRLTAATKRP
jgi:hypothetical protein